MRELSREQALKVGVAIVLTIFIAIVAAVFLASPVMTAVGLTSLSA